MAPINRMRAAIRVNAMIRGLPRMPTLRRAWIRNKGAVAVIEIDRRTDTRDLKRLPPRSRSEMFCSFDSLGFGLSRRDHNGHRFGQNSAIHFRRRLNSENLQNCWRQIDVATREIIRFAALKIWAGSNQSVVHVESAQCSVSPLSCRSLPIRVDHPRDVELIS